MPRSQSGQRRCVPDDQISSQLALPHFHAEYAEEEARIAASGLTPYYMDLTQAQVLANVGRQTT
jgi:hypothetical protein